MTREQQEAFVKALNALCKKHGMYITLGCGCCNGCELEDLKGRRAYTLTKIGTLDEDLS